MPSLRFSLALVALSFANSVRPAGVSEHDLRNPGFEANLTGWSLHIYGAKAYLEQ
jgi:hypothetical protein